MRSEKKPYSTSLSAHPTITRWSAQQWHRLRQVHNGQRGGAGRTPWASTPYLIRNVSPILVQFRPSHHVGGLSIYSIEDNSWISVYSRPDPASVGRQPQPSPHPDARNTKPKSWGPIFKVSTSQPRGPWPANKSSRNQSEAQHDSYSNTAYWCRIISDRNLDFNCLRWWINLDTAQKVERCIEFHRFTCTPRFQSTKHKKRSKPFCPAVLDSPTDMHQCQGQDGPDRRDGPQRVAELHNEK